MGHDAEQQKKEHIRQEEERRRVEEGGYRDQRCEPRSRAGADRKNEWQKRREERMPQSGPYPNAKQRATPYHRYTMRWQKLQDSQTDPSKKSQRIWAFRDIPWPIHPTPASPLNITKERIKTFFFNSATCNGYNCSETRTKIIKQELLRWHPDKFEVSVLPLVYEGEWQSVKDGLHIVSIALTTLLNEERQRSGKKT